MRFGSHADRAFCGKRGLVGPPKNPRLAATAVANTLTVATHAFFICGGELEVVMGHFHEIRRTVSVATLDDGSTGF